MPKPKPQLTTKRPTLKNEKGLPPTAESIMGEDKTAVYFLKLPESFKDQLKIEAIHRKWSLNKYIVEILKARDKILTDI